MSDKSDGEALLLACRELASRMDAFDDAVCRRLGINRSDLRALNLLEHGPRSAASLATELGLTRGSVTALVDRLAKAGYLSRDPDPADRRGVRIALRPPTWHALADVYRPLGETVRETGAALADEHRAVVVDALRRIAGAFAEREHRLRDGTESERRARRAETD